MKHTIDRIFRDILLNFEAAPADDLGAQVAEALGARGPMLAAQLAMKLQSFADDPCLPDMVRKYAQQKLDSLLSF